MAYFVVVVVVEVLPSGVVVVTEPLAAPLTDVPEGVVVVAVLSGVVVAVEDVVDEAGGVTTVVEEDGLELFSTVVVLVDAGRSQPVAKAAARARAAATGMSFMTSP